MDGDFGKLGSNISLVEGVDKCLKNPANFCLIEGMFRQTFQQTSLEIFTPPWFKKQQVLMGC